MVMHWLFRLLTLVALLVAPMAAPASATTPVKAVAADCQSMDMGSVGHRMPAGHHRAGEACCIAVPPAIDPPLAALDVAPLIEHPTFIAFTEPFHLGAGPNAEDPPPRIV